MTKYLYMCLQEVSFTKLDTTASVNGGLIGAIEILLNDVFLPCLKGMGKGWNYLEGFEGLPARNSLINSLQSFSSVLSGK